MLTMKKHQKLQLIRDSGIIAIMRANSSKSLLSAAEALLAGRVRVIEVTMTTPGAQDVVSAAAQRFIEEVLFEAGSFLGAETASSFIQADATTLSVGSNLISQELLDSGDIAEIIRRAKAYSAAVKDVH